MINYDQKVEGMADEREGRELGEEADSGNGEVGRKTRFIA